MKLDYHAAEPVTSVAMKLETLRANKILDRTRHTMAVQEEALASIPAYQPVSPVDMIMDKCKQPTCQYDLLYKMAVPKLYRNQQLRLHQHAFLRRVEQVKLRR